MKRPLPTQTGFALIPPPKVFSYLDAALSLPFESRAEAFSAVNASWLADISLLTYEAADRQAQVLRGAGFSHVLHVDGTENGCHGVIAGNDACVVIAFRGTRIKSFRDVVTDAQMAPSPEPGLGHVHSGFRKSLNEVWDTAVQHLRRPELDCGPGAARRLWLTGHSLGGALATLAAARLPHAAGLYTFGCPKVGDVEFHREFNRRNVATNTFRFVHARDAVVHLPPSLAPGLKQKLLSFGADKLLAALDRAQYEHVGSARYIDRQGSLLTDAPEWKDIREHYLRRIENLVGRVKVFKEGLKLDADFFRIDEVDDHAPIFYATHLFNALRDERGG